MGAYHTVVILRGFLFSGNQTMDLPSFKKSVQDLGSDCFEEKHIFVKLGDNLFIELVSNGTSNYSIIITELRRSRDKRIFSTNFVQLHDVQQTLKQFNQLKTKTFDVLCFLLLNNHLKIIAGIDGTLLNY